MVVVELGNTSSSSLSSADVGSAGTGVVVVVLVVVVLGADVAVIVVVATTGALVLDLFAESQVAEPRLLNSLNVLTISTFPREFGPVNMDLDTGQTMNIAAVFLLPSGESDPAIRYDFERFEFCLPLGLCIIDAL